MPVSPSKRKPSTATPCAPPRLGSVSKPLNRLCCAPDDAPRRCRSVRIQETYPDEPPPCRTPPGTRLARPWTSRQTLDARGSGFRPGAPYRRRHIANGLPALSLGADLPSDGPPPQRCHPPDLGPLGHRSRL